MRKLCPNFDRKDGLDTVLEIPIPEEVFSGNDKSNSLRSWQKMKAWFKTYCERSPPSTAAVPIFGGKNTEIQLLLGVVGAPLIPFSIKNSDHDHPIYKHIKDHPIEASMAKYIVKQYIAAVGGERALNSVESMYAMGKVKMAASEFCTGEGSLSDKVTVKVKNLRSGGGGEMGGFVLWQKRPELWCLELVVSGCKISAGSDGKVAWRQTPWHHSHRGPPRPLRRFFQGLDPKSTANLFSNSVCVGEKSINNDDCFVLKLEAESSTLRARRTSRVEILRHTIWGYFSQRTGLLVNLEDSHLLRISGNKSSNGGVFWETKMESLVQDYRSVDGISVAHAGRTRVSLYRFGESSEGHSRTRMEEVWAIEEVDFNIKGLSMDCFLPPADLKKKKKKVEEEEEAGFGFVKIDDDDDDDGRLPYKIRAAAAALSRG